MRSRSDVVRNAILIAKLAVPFYDLAIVRCLNISTIETSQKSFVVSPWAVTPEGNYSVSFDNSINYRDFNCMSIYHFRTTVMIDCRLINSI